MIEKPKTRYPLAIATVVKNQAEEEAKRNRRSLNAELGLLIEEGFKWRQMREMQRVEQHTGIRVTA